MKNLKKNNNKESGLTLLELIVAIGLFGLVLSMIFGIFGIAVISQRRIIALRNVEDNIRFSIESMAREIRTGRNFSLSGSSLLFTNARNESVVYRLNNSAVEKSSDGGANYFSVTGPETTINYLNFFMSGQVSGDGLQPRITIAIGATSRIGNQTGNLKVQSTVSARLLQN